MEGVRRYDQKFGLQRRRAAATSAHLSVPFSFLLAPDSSILTPYCVATSKLHLTFLEFFAAIGRGSMGLARNLHPLSSTRAA